MESLPHSYPELIGLGIICLANLIRGLLADKKITRIHMMINGRMDQLLESKIKEAYEKGLKASEGKK